MCPFEHNKIVEVEKRIQGQILKVPANRSYTLEYFLSQKTVVPNGKKQLGLFVLETSEWAVPENIGKPSISDIQQVASTSFLRTKTQPIRERYQQLLQTAVAKISPVADIFPVYRDGTTPLMFAFYQGAGTTTSYMLQLTELLKQNEIVAHRKFIETFANGIIVFSLYILPSPQLRIRLDTLLKQFSMLHLVPESTLTPRFLNGEYTAEQYTYFSTASRFVYYFLNKRSEEFDVLAKSLKNDQLNLGRLRLLQTRLKREAVSQERIFNTLINHPQVGSELFNDFHRMINTTFPSPYVPVLNTDIAAKIKNEATTVLDQQILTGLLSFNAHILKTNFYNSSKASLSFRLDPRFLAESDWPQVPFGLFFVMGSDFQVNKHSSIEMKKMYQLVYNHQIFIINLLVFFVLFFRVFIFVFVILLVVVFVLFVLVIVKHIIVI
jgi:glutamate dehydrogenase